MKKALAISSVLLGVVFLAGCGQKPVSQLPQSTISNTVAQTQTTNQLATTQTEPQTQSNAHSEVIDTAKKSDSKEYKSASTFSFSYPSQVCDSEGKKCYSIILTENKSIITLDASAGGLFKIYHGVDIINETSANIFLQKTLSNELCKINTNETDILQGTTIKNVFLDEGCSLYGPAYEKYSSTHPDAIGLAGKSRAYWATDSKEMIVYVIAAGGGCAFIDCKTEEEISRSINLDGINVFDKSMSNT